jgi:uncharacterized protein (DUF1015 family)
MAKVSPFQPYRYTPAAGPLDQLVTQPYDKISPTMQERYLALNPHNLVRVILGPRSDSDTASDSVYTRAAKYFEEWIAQGILAKEDAPAFLAYFQEFDVPDSGERAVRKGFIGLGPVEEYSAGVVHRHEQTLSGPKKDRLQVLDHTHAHFGQLFMLYPDVESAVDKILDAAAEGAPLCVVTDEYGTVHKLWKIADPAATARISELMDDKKLLIADGHHRYETALAFHNAHPEMQDARKVMMTFVNMYSPGLKILATHRLVSGLREFSLESFLREARTEFTVRELLSLEELKRQWAQPHPGLIRFGVAVEDTNAIYLLERERQPEELDVPLLHSLVIQELLGVNEDAVREEKNIRYIRGAEAAVAEVRQGKAQLALLLEPTSVQDVANVSFSGGVMPQKSTDFYPKLLTGIAIYRLEK